MSIRNRQRCRLRVEELESRVVPATPANSLNWSGYAVNTGSGAVTTVSGDWVVPAVSTTVSGYSSAWVGIDGWSSNTVEQIGTDSDYVNGQVQYYAWYEMYPAAPVNLSMTITPGDTIQASVTYTGSGQFVLNLADLTSNATPFSTTQTASSAQRSSAEWIQEAPSSIFGVLPLANFGTINFSQASAGISGSAGPIDNSWGNTTLYQVNMVTSSGALKATTSALSDSGSPPTSSFSVTWVSSGSKSGGGGHHKSPDQTTAAQQAAALVTVGGPSALGTPATHAVAGPATAPVQNVVQPSVSVVSLLPLVAQPAVSLPERTAGDATVPTMEQSVSPEQLPLPSELIPPPAGAAPASPDVVPDQSVDPASSAPDASLAADAIFADGRWAPAVETGPAAAADSAPVIESPGLALALALGGVWGIATREAAERRQRQRVS